MSTSWQPSGLLVFAFLLLLLGVFQLLLSMQPEAIPRHSHKWSALHRGTRGGGHTLERLPGRLAAEREARAASEASAAAASRSQPAAVEPHHGGSRDDVPSALAAARAALSAGEQVSGAGYAALLQEVNERESLRLKTTGTPAELRARYERHTSGQRRHQARPAAADSEQADDEAVAAPDDVDLDAASLSTADECAEPSRELQVALSFAPPTTDDKYHYRDFAGAPTLAERAAAFRAPQLAAGETLPPVPCGFLAPDAFGRAREVLAPAHAHCPIVVVTANFGAYDKLVQPRYVPRELADCFFAFVDLSTKKQMREDGLITEEKKLKGFIPRSHAWRLVAITDKKPFEQPRRNARVAKLLLPRLFPSANFSIWVDAHIALMLDPREMVRRFLTAPGARLAAIRHYKRRDMREELEQLQRDLPKNGTSRFEEFQGGGRTKEQELLRQWSFYEREQRALGAANDWWRQTVLVEGGLVLSDVQSPTAQLIHCNWFNEFTRFFERDLLPLSYTLRMMGLTPRPGCRNVVHAISAKAHWYNTDIKENDLAFRCGHRHEFKPGCRWLRTEWPV